MDATSRKPYQMGKKEAEDSLKSLIVSSLNIPSIIDGYVSEANYNDMTNTFSKFEYFITTIGMWVHISLNDGKLFFEEGVMSQGRLTKTAESEVSLYALTLDNSLDNPLVRFCKQSETAQKVMDSLNSMYEDMDYTWGDNEP